jgi:hypothetical protein
MIQRPQSLLLLIVFVLSLLPLTGPLSVFVTEGSELVLSHSGLREASGTKLDLPTWPLMVYFALMAALGFFTLFSYRNRVRQMRLCIFLMILAAGSVGMILFYHWMIHSTRETTATLYRWRSLIPPVNFVLLYLAFRMIRRDELLVKAYDRIR